MADTSTFDDSADGFVQHVGRSICVELRRPSILEVLTPNIGGVVFPETYFKACCEMITIMLLGSIIITMIFNQEVVWDNPLNDRIGYPNLCVFFDTFPAKYYATVCWGFIIYLGCQFAWLDIERTIMVKNRLSGCKIFFSVATDILFICSIIVFLFVFVIAPDCDLAGADCVQSVQVWRHSWSFIVLIFVMYLVVLANMMEGQNTPVFSYVWMVMYGVCAICDVVFICGNFIYYNHTGTGPLFPVPLGFMADYGWFCMTPLCTLFLPNAEGIKQRKSIVDDITELEAGEKDETIGCCSGDYDDLDNDEIDFSG
jgi:hypothetical protein